MPEPTDLFAMGNGAVVAPAGHGKTETISHVAALGQRSLILTHTHAGVHAIRARLKRLGVPLARVAVDTIAGWSMRYAHAFPGVAQPPDGMPQGAEWDQLYRGATATLDIQAVRKVVEASYDRILIDEYQDCHSLQHELALALSDIVPTLVFGDPMQGIFEFAGAALNWDRQIHARFPLAGTLPTPHRWAEKNPDLGQWIAETREKLTLGQPIDLADPRITYRPSNDVFDMATLFGGLEGKEGTFAAIHCNKGLCYQLAKACGGGYQAIEELGARRLGEFAAAWDHASGAEERLRAITTLLNDCFHKRPVVEGAPGDSEDVAVLAALRAAALQLGIGNGAAAAAKFIALSRKRPRWKLYRGGLWRDAERACSELAADRVESMTAASDRIRQRVASSGRKLPRRILSTPFLLKGLEFDHVVIPDATHFGNERQAQAKLFYVAISRATRSLTISSSSRWLRFPVPSL